MGGEVASFVFLVDPVGKPRMTRRSVHSKAAKRYWEFKDELLRQAGEWKPNPERPLELLFAIPMPSSWSDKKKMKMSCSPHQSKPDLDNLEKAFLDCFGEDKKFSDIHARKVWDYCGSIIVWQ